jgi:hypothetical protein
VRKQQDGTLGQADNAAESEPDEVIQVGDNHYTAMPAAAGGGTSTATYTVTVDGTPFTVTQAINNSSYTPGQNYLIQYVAQGKY